MPNYSHINESIRQRFESIVGVKNVSLIDEDLKKHAIDESPLEPHLPEIIVKPNNTAQISNLLALCNELLIPVTTQGSRTGLSGASHPIIGGVALSTEQMNRILELDEKNLTCTVESGVLVSEVHDFVEKAGLYYPPDPGQESGSIGGNVNTNAGGMRAVKYGVTRDYVQALEVVLASGEIVEMGGKNIKDTTGYSLIDLMIGSEGTLGVISKVTLKLVPKPKLTALIYAPFNRPSEAIDTVSKIIRLNIQPFALEYIPQHSVLTIEKYIERKLPDNSHAAYLIIGLEANSESELWKSLEEVGEICVEQGAVDVFIADKTEQQRQIWEARKSIYDAYKTFFELDEADICIPRSRVSEFIEMTELIASKRGVIIAAVGHVGDGNIHCNIIRQAQNNSAWPIVLENTISDLIDQGIKMGGTVSGEHGLGYTKRPYLERKVGKTQVEIMKRIKNAFDPNNILNPEKLWL